MPSPAFTQRISTFLNRLAIRNKLFLAFGLNIGLFFLFSIATTIALLDIKYNQIDAQTTIIRAREALLLANQNETNFKLTMNSNTTGNPLYTTGTNADVKAWSENYAIVHNNLNLYLSYNRTNTSTEKQIIDKLNILLLDYHSLFLLEVAKYRQIGNDD